MCKTRLRELRKAAGRSQQSVADAIGVSDTSYQNYEYGKRDIPGDVIQRLASLYRVTTDYLLNISDNTSYASAFVTVPLYGAVAAGIPIEMIEDKVMKEAPARFLEDDPDCYFVIVNGESENRRHLHDGDYALVSPKYKDTNPDDLFLVAVNGDNATIKQVAKLDYGCELIPDSYDPTYKRQVFDYNESDTPTVTIMGKIVWHCAAF